MPISATLWRLRPEDPKFKANLGYIVRLNKQGLEIAQWFSPEDPHLIPNTHTIVPKFSFNTLLWLLWAPTCTYADIT